MAGTCEMGITVYIERYIQARRFYGKERNCNDSRHPLTLIGPELKVGDKAPEFTVLDSDLKEVKLQEFKERSR